ncbi:mitochondrial import inner membrane translocase subunit Tim10 B-like [Branchiostoma floridae]|uniref:Mitochondrial import inner membrane translocase subunit Tim10 B-like n=2 Tax=Branchiostoma floridae TaxID=7739 RepID=A0A9J7LI29_BRAFL|nr:mitochondrial import inner membrane translocase subunit Tim10 B-like [Branchiostoma floridae]
MDPAQFQANLRNLRDFLAVYNRLTEHCFSRCVSNMNYRYLTREEEVCLDGCSGKLINANHRIIQKFAEIGPYAKLQQEQERAAAQAAAEAAAQAGAAGAQDIPTPAGVPGLPQAMPGVDSQLQTGAAPVPDSGVTATQVLGAMAGQPAAVPPVPGAVAAASIEIPGSAGPQGLATNVTQQQSTT